MAMSGGVDSSVAAYLLMKEGFEVAGLSFELWDRRDISRFSTCCSHETIEMAREVSEIMGIPHYSVDVKDAFYRYVIEDFCEAYLSGATPNPCILCNKYIKFAFLLKKADEIGADIIATGHYARGGIPRYDEAERRDGKRFYLKKGVDVRKDQSYVLYVMTQQELSRTVFPLGKMRKEDTRRIAENIGLKYALRPESQEICFVGEGHYADFLRSYNADVLAPGPIVNEQGDVLGTHRGVALYTVGQRKRIGIPSLTPLYVLDIDPEKNAIIVGGWRGAMKSSVLVGNIHWVSVDRLREPVRAGVKIRSTMAAELSTIIPAGDGIVVEFDAPQWAPAPGQSAVFYQDDVVLGGGVIEREAV